SHCRQQTAGTLTRAPSGVGSCCCRNYCDRSLSTTLHRTGPGIDTIAVMVFFYFLAALSIWFGIQSLLNGIRYAAYVRRETGRAVQEFQPFVSVIAPGRGLEQGLTDNLRTLLTQDYPRYEVFFVFDRQDDPAVKVVEELSHGFSRMARTIIAGSATDSGQKVH